MADEKYTYAAEFSDAAGQLDRMRDSLKDANSSTSNLVGLFTNIKTAAEEVHDKLSALSDLQIIKNNDVKNSDKLLSNMQKMKKMEDDKKRKMEQQVGLIRAMGAISSNITRNFKITEGQLNNIAKRMTDIRGTAAQVVTSHIGFDLSLGGIIMKLIEVNNISRKIHGEAMMIGGMMGGTPEDIKAASASIHELNAKFALSYDEAAKINTVLSKVGISSERLSQGARIQQKEFRATQEIMDRRAELIAQEETHYGKAQRLATNSRATAEDIYKEILAGNAAVAKRVTLENSVAQKEKQHVEEAQRIARYNATAASISSELFSIQVKYGIGVQQSADQLKNLMANYGKTGDSARSLYGTVLGTYAVMKKESKLPFDISVDEMVSDWGQLIDYARVYKMDLLGILSVYQSMLRDSKLIGLEGVSTQVKKEITKTLVSAPLEMSYGWKARLAGGTGTPAQRALEFERRASSKEDGPLYVLKKTVEAMDDMLGGVTEGNKDDQEIRGRKLLENMGYGKESAIELTRAWIKKDLTGKNVDGLLEKQAEALKKMEERERDWPTQRQSLVSYAEKAQKAVTSTQQLIERWIVNELIPVVWEIRDFLSDIADSRFFGGTGTRSLQKDLAEDLGEKLGAYGISEGNAKTFGKLLSESNDMKSLIESTSVFKGNQQYKRKQYEKVAVPEDVINKKLREDRSLDLTQTTTSLVEDFIKERSKDPKYRAEMAKLVALINSGQTKSQEQAVQIMRNMLNREFLDRGIIPPRDPKSVGKGSLTP